MAKVENEVRECDRCHSLYTIWWNSDKDCGPDYQVTYLGKHLDLCDDCYNIVTKWLRRESVF